MSITWYPPGWELHVDNPGWGEIVIVAPYQPYDAPALVVDEDWRAELRGPAIGEFLAAVTTRAFESDTTPASPAGPLPPFLTPAVARGLLPALQRAVVLATAGSDRFERTFPDPAEPPAEPLCVRCHLGTPYTPGALPSTWCDQHGHDAYGYRPSTSWQAAQDSYEWDRRRWDRQRELDQVLDLSRPARP